MEEPVEIALRAVVHDHSLRDVEAVGCEKLFGILWDSRSQAANENQPPGGLFTRFYVKFVGQRPGKNTKETATGEKLRKHRFRKSWKSSANHAERSPFCPYGTTVYYD